MLKLPRQSEVAAALASVIVRTDWSDVRKHSEPGETPSIDVRLQVERDGAWDVHSGDASYDVDHRGWWGASSVTGPRDDILGIARDMIEQVADSAACSGETIDENATDVRYRQRLGKGWRIIDSDDEGRTFDVVGEFATLAEMGEQRRLPLAPFQERERKERKRRREFQRHAEALRNARDAFLAVATDEEREEFAHNMLRANYWSAVRAMAEDVTNEAKDNVRDGMDADEAVSERLHEAVDGSAWVIYTANALEVLRYGTNHDAYTEEFGEPPTIGGDLNWSALAFATMEQDVRELIDVDAIRSAADAAEGGETE